MLVLQLVWSTLIVSQVVLTLGSLEGLAPEAVGDAVLSGRVHDRI